MSLIDFLTGPCSAIRKRISPKVERIIKAIPILYFSWVDTNDQAHQLDLTGFKWHRPPFLVPLMFFIG